MKIRTSAWLDWQYHLEQAVGSSYIDLTDTTEFESLLLTAQNIPNPLPATEALDFAILVALALCTDDADWNSLQSQQTLTDFCNQISNLLRQHSWKEGREAHALEITLAWLHGAGRTVFDPTSKGLDGCPERARSYVQQYIWQTVFSVTSWLSSNHAPRGPRVPGLTGQIPIDSYAQLIYSHLVSLGVKPCPCCKDAAEKRDLDFARLEVDADLEAAKDNERKHVRQCLKYHRLPSFIDQGDSKWVCLGNFLQTAVKGKYGGVKASALTSGMLYPYLHRYHGLDYVTVAVRVCPDCKPRQHKANASLPGALQKGVPYSYTLNQCHICRRPFGTGDRVIIKKFHIVTTDAGGFYKQSSWTCPKCHSAYPAVHCREARTEHKRDKPTHDQCPFCKTPHADGRSWNRRQVYWWLGDPSPSNAKGYLEEQVLLKARREHFPRWVLHIVWVILKEARANQSSVSPIASGFGELADADLETLHEKLANLGSTPKSVDVFKRSWREEFAQDLQDIKNAILNETNDSYSGMAESAFQNEVGFTEPSQESDLQ